MDSKRRFFTFLLLYLIATNALPANYPIFAIEFQSGFRTFDMSDLSAFNQTVQKSIPFETSLVSDFPPYIYFRPMISLNWESFNLGVLASFQSSGSRISSKDYSAEYRFDMRIHSFQYGIHLNKKIFEAERFSFLLSTSSGATFSGLDLEEYLRVGKSVLVSEQAPFKSKNWFLEGGIATKYKLSIAFSLSVKLAYQLSLGKDAFKHNEHEYILKNPRTFHEVGPGWNGFILGITAIINPGNLKKP